MSSYELFLTMGFSMKALSTCIIIKEYKLNVMLPPYLANGSETVLLIISIIADGRV